MNTTSTGSRPVLAKHQVSPTNILDDLFKPYNMEVGENWYLARTGCKPVNCKIVYSFRNDFTLKLRYHLRIRQNEISIRFANTGLELITDFRSQLIDIGVATQTPAAQQAMMGLIQFEETTNLAYPLRYLLAVAFTTHPGEYLIKDLLVGDYRLLKICHYLSRGDLFTKQQNFTLVQIESICRQ